MGGLGLVQCGLRLAQLQLGGFVLCLEDFKLCLDLFGFELRLVAGLGPFLGSAIELNFTIDDFACAMKHSRG
ncbi:hypothetical protein D3C86_2029060 [compost metagenome]